MMGSCDVSGAPVYPALGPCRLGAILRWRGSSEADAADAAEQRAVNICDRGPVFFHFLHSISVL